MTWYKSKMTAAEMNKFIASEFPKLFLSVLDPKGVACFQSLKPTGKLFNVYFSPLWEKHLPTTLSKYSAEPCDKPDRKDVSFMGGHDEDKDLI